MLVGEENSRVGSECKETWNMVCCEVNGLLPEKQSDTAECEFSFQSGFWWFL